ncbi:3-phosphoserine/phosphohydroxythreonine transaminase [Candidatus Epulonipiscium viviparus]|uniref:3-phosphoserine/phosphohydroxythreonine transaminase n=1 Tax=Candidatus Epulonipiscium viviparus TaxID=420336 RepID=UPI00016C0F1E|nr:3-phosphoserine/phosphohydroxythreonine transaminase [Candidatus Epulopiscium viviparus]
MQRYFNFSAGPSMLPLEVLEEAQKEFVCYADSGMSVMEMSHRSKVYEDIIFTAETNLRELMHIPDNYSVMFLQGGASTQFAMVPLNLLVGSKKADYVNTGQWSKRAIAEAKKYGSVNVVASSEDTVFNHIPALPATIFDKDADYVYLTLNNTIYGTHIPNDKLPDTNGVPLVGDMSSNILAEPYDISKFGIVFAGAQKNLGPAGVTIAIVRNDLIGKHQDITPTMLQYSTHAAEKSLYNTPPTYSIYFAGLVFKWAKKLGGIDYMYALNKKKAAILYDYLDNSKLFKGTVRPEDRSLMNVPFVLPTKELDAKFIKQAESLGFVNLKGHRTVGGMRASIYNAMPIEGVEKLVALMKTFEEEN